MMSAEVQSDFSGTGPVAQWDASLPLLGDEKNGQLAVDFSVAAGVLFGKQDTSVEGERTVRYYSATGAYVVNGSWVAPIEDDTTPLDVAPRSQDTTTPLLDLSLGLSYDVGRIKVGAGYRWERYFDVLDTGFGEREETDRTIDGPYFKLSVGFGG